MGQWVAIKTTQDQPANIQGRVIGLTPTTFTLQGNPLAAALSGGTWTALIPATRPPSKLRRTTTHVTSDPTAKTLLLTTDTTAGLAAGQMVFPELFDTVFYQYWPITALTTQQITLDLGALATVDAVDWTGNWYFDAVT